ncbi:class II aldolase/adducin family protein [Azospirillum sp. ST 5-10]|uniref:class II aldolase/adducin family protein n=1 Tax=unclassified Azospirillum TaxID=2630922 RepID=UPI003F4A1439
MACQGCDTDHHGAGADAAEVAAGEPIAASRELVEDLAAANRILYHRGVVDAFGHVSVRHDRAPDRFLLARNMAPGHVTAEDIMEFDLDGRPFDPRGRRVYLERFIHGEIFRARPDVVAVVHSHSPAVVPFSVVKSVPLQAMCHMGGFLASPVPVFEIRDVAGPATDLLIRDRPLGAALADALGGSPAVLMRGHGSTVVGRSLREAVFRAVYTEVNARLQSEALRLGPVTYLTPEEGAATTATNAGQIDRAWNLWREQAAEGAK